MAVPNENRRQANRLQHEIPVAYRSAGGFLTDWATDISQGGMFINALDPLPIGSEVKLLIQMPTMEFPLALAGRVARVVRPEDGGVPGMGIEFEGLDASRRDQIASLVRRLQRDLGS